MYEVLIWATGAVAFGFTVEAYRSTRDVFHPFMFLGPMLSVPYFVNPMLLYARGHTPYFLPIGAMAAVQLYFVLATIFLASGTLSTGRPQGTRNSAIMPHWKLRLPMRQAGIALGIIGVGAFYYMLWETGGFEGAYGEAHGRPWSDSGYVRNLVYWVLPGLILIMISQAGQTFAPRDFGTIAFIAAPIALHGLLSASRGPTFMILVTLGLGWYMVKLRRPALLVFLTAGLLTGALILFLVTHRDSLHLGAGNIEFKGGSSLVDFLARAETGNEYIYGSGTIINTKRTGDYEWGARYVLNLLVRPIPRQLWPTQYEDARRYLGMAEYRTSLDHNVRTLGWRATGGSSMGLYAEVWQQFWWFSLPFLWLVGWCFGRVWRMAVSQGGVWLVCYVIMISLSIYMTQQTLQAFLWRFMFIAAGGWLAWRIFVQPHWRRLVRVGDRSGPEQIADTGR